MSANAETPLQNKIRLALSQAGCLNFRNETAGAWVGKVIHREGHIVTLKGASMITAGLCVGSSDIIGIAPTLITQDMVGKTVGVFVAAEVKTPQSGDDGSDEQKKFLAAIIKAGGIAGIVTSPDEALALIGNNKK
jgi:hypothetical protein